MVERRREVVAELEAALERDDGVEKNFHVRQALQLLELAGELDRNDGRERGRS